MSKMTLSRLITIVSLLALLLMVGVAAAQETTPEPSAPVSSPSTETAAPPASGAVTALRHTHSLVRWLVVIVTVVALIRLGMGVVQGGTYDAMTQRIMQAFAGLTSLQWLIGLIFMFVYGSYLGLIPGHVWGHLVVMTIAVALSHMHNMFKKKPDNVRFRNSLLLVIGVVVLVIIGVALLPQGWRIFPS
ncbi:MAG: hypothetical protein K8L97_33975 [Anaerolineae bacterium]|nr:hypothetical protein [Anaerolineae bacterium]